MKKKTLLLIAGIVWLMGGGIGFRAVGIFSDIFVAFFYSGVGKGNGSINVQIFIHRLANGAVSGMM